MPSLLLMSIYVSTTRQRRRERTSYFPGDLCGTLSYLNGVSFLPSLLTDRLETRSQPAQAARAGFRKDQLERCFINLSRYILNHTIHLVELASLDARRPLGWQGRSRSLGRYQE
jgi:hypothetical protein